MSVCEPPKHLNQTCLPPTLSVTSLDRASPPSLEESKAVYNEKIKSVWLAQAKKPNTPGWAASGWAISFFTENDSLITIYPKKVSREDCEAITEVWSISHGSRQGRTLLQRFIEITDTRFSREAVEGVTLGMISADTGRSGLYNYNLKEGRGLRFYLLLYISVIQSRFKTQEWQEPITSTALAYMQYLWGEKTDIKPGTPVRQFVKETGRRAWRECLAEVGAFRDRDG
ncbi:hypothetical protein GGR57DRAFT_514115 [Xylariaceae sp. FL1272]|nr:hypothetical protein GGR57DRAFT_514115 [Xylariaceae sp. FL1272]